MSIGSKTWRRFRLFWPSNNVVAPDGKVHCLSCFKVVVLPANQLEQILINSTGRGSRNIEKVSIFIQDDRSIDLL